MQKVKYYSNIGLTSYLLFYLEVFLERIIACSKAIYVKYLNWDLVLKL